jgi:hypothetical protein
MTRKRPTIIGLPVNKFERPATGIRDADAQSGGAPCQ